MLIENHALSAQGSRRLTLTMLAVREQADCFEGVAPGSAKPLRFLVAFQEAEPYLGLPPQTFKLVAWLVKMTRPQDWEAGSRPIVWPSAMRQQEFLGLTASAVKTLNRALFEAGVFVLRDSPTGKRYGRRDERGRIIEAYGFDLSPLAFRAEEFIRLAAEARAERERRQALKRRATCARRAIAQIGATLAEAGALHVDWQQLAAETAGWVAATRKAATSEDLARAVRAIEERRAQAEAWGNEVAKAGKTDPQGPADRPHTIATNSETNPSDTVTPSMKSNWVEAAPERDPPIAIGERKRCVEPPAKVYPAELLVLAPRLAEHVTQPYPDWADIVNAAGAGLRSELGVSPRLWGEACLAIGRPLAAIALAVVSTKPHAHFTRGSGGYFAAMIKRSKAGKLHLDRSLWKLRRDRLDRGGRQSPTTAAAEAEAHDSEALRRRASSAGRGGRR